jgi:hypothetical protein
MKRSHLHITVSLLFIVSIVFAVGSARVAGRKRIAMPRIKTEPRPVELPQSLSGDYSRKGMPAASADTMVLGSWDFDDGTAQGWTVHDRTGQHDVFTHIADYSELNGGDYGMLFPLSGMQSLWCGKSPTSLNPYCHWETLPGYGHAWDQRFESTVFYGDSMKISFKIQWDIEPSYDGLQLQYYDHSTGQWEDLNDTPFDGSGFADTSFALYAPQDSTRFRFRFTSDEYAQQGGWDDEDGLWNTDGAYLLDDLVVERLSCVPGPGVVGTVSGWSGTSEKVALQDNHIYVTKGYGGVQAVDISEPELPVMDGLFDTPGFARGIVASDGYLFVADDNSLQVLDISVPGFPSYAGSAVLFSGIGIDGEGVAVSGDQAFVAHYFGLEVFDVSTPSNPIPRGTAMITGAKGVAVEGDYAYVVGGASGLDVVNIFNPMNPIVVGSLPFWVGTSYDVALSGNYAYIAAGDLGLAVVDISDPSSPSLLGGLDTGGQAYSVDIVGDSAYVADGSGGFLLADISNPLSVQDAGGCALPSDATGIAVEGKYAYVVTSSDGPQIVDLEGSCEGGEWTTICQEYFEIESPGDISTLDGLWSASIPEPFGAYAVLRSGAEVMQDGRCADNDSYLWTFYDDGTGEIPFGPDENGYYIDNLLISPDIPLIGSGTTFELHFSVYRDLPIDDLVFYYWKVRSCSSDCAGPWKGDNYFYWGEEKDWILSIQDISTFIDAGAEYIQVAVGVVDMCPVYCGSTGSGANHTNAPLIDDIQVIRINHKGPVFSVRNYNLFQDTFAFNGYASPDRGCWIYSYEECSKPYDNIMITVSDPECDLAIDSYTGLGPAVYAYLKVLPQEREGISGETLQDPWMRPGFGIRYPVVDSLIHEGDMWYKFRMDSAYATDCSGDWIYPISDAYSFDLSDQVLVAGDTVCYLFCAVNLNGEESHYSREHSGQGDGFITDDLREAMDCPMEFTVLPAGGDILYIDGCDDSGGPAQLYFEEAFELYGIQQRIDRFDVLGPSSNVGNSPSNYASGLQLIPYYSTIIWSTGDLETGLPGDGTDPPTGSDYQMLYSFLQLHPNNPGVYITGDNIAEDWDNLTGAGAILLQSEYMNFDLVSGDHVSAGDSEAPLLEGSGDIFVNYGVPDRIVAYGDCPAIKNYDVLQATGGSIEGMVSTSSGSAYILSQSTPNAAGSQARIVLSGFSFTDIVNSSFTYDPFFSVWHLDHILDWLWEDYIPELEWTIVSDLQDLLRYPKFVEICGDLAYVVGRSEFLSFGSYLHVVDISDPASPVVIGSCSLPDHAEDIAFRTGYIYSVHYYDGMRVVDVSTPSSPTVIADLSTNGYMTGIATWEHFAFITSINEGLLSVILNPPTAPDSVGCLRMADAPEAVRISGNYAFVTAGDSVHAVDICTPSYMSHMGGCPAAGAYDIDIDGDLAALAVNDLPAGSPDGIQIIDISVPAAPVVLGEHRLAFGATSVNIDTSRVYLADGLGAILVYDVASPVQPVLEGRLSSKTYTYLNAVPHDGHIYVPYVSGNVSSSPGGLLVLTSQGPVTGSNEQVPEFRNHLSQNFPNPFNPSTTINYGIRKAGHVKLEIYDVRGRLVKTLVDKRQRQGEYTATWNGRNNHRGTVASGVYFIMLRSGSMKETRKMVLLR